MIFTDDVAQHLKYLREWEFAEIKPIGKTFESIIDGIWTRIKIKSKLKRCVGCGRLSPYIQYHSLIYGWRLCWEHLDYYAKILLSVN